AASSRWPPEGSWGRSWPPVTSTSSWVASVWSSQSQPPHRCVATSARRRPWVPTSMSDVTEGRGGPPFGPPAVVSERPPAVRDPLPLRVRQVLTRQLRDRPGGRAGADRREHLRLRDSRALPLAPPAGQTAAMASTEMDLARANGLGEVLRRSAARFPSKAAIIDGDTRLTFRELDDLVTAVAAGLAERGVTKGDRVALLSRNSADFAAVAWGAARLGAILVPVNFMLTADEVGYIVGDSEPVAFVAQPEFVATADEAIV